MDARRDPLLAAAEVILAVRRLVIETNRPTARATVGQLYVEPNVTSAVPERVRFVVDLRDVEGSPRAALAARIEQAVATACAREQVLHTVTVSWSAVPGPTDPTIQATIAAACAELGEPFHRLISGASHDAQNLAQVVPAGMIFVPSRDGRSHSPAEFTSFEDLACGTDVLIAVLVRLSAA
jgi:hydantoinase/carbamoylase family amidase